MHGLQNIYITSIHVSFDNTTFSQDNWKYNITTFKSLSQFKKINKNFLTVIQGWQFWLFLWNFFFFWLKSDFFIFFKICCIFAENWTNSIQKEDLMMIFLIFYPYFQLCSLNSYPGRLNFFRLAFYWKISYVFAENCTKKPMFGHIWLNFL